MTIGGASSHPHRVALVVMFHAPAGAVDVIAVTAATQAATRNRCGALLYTSKKRRYCQRITMCCMSYFGAKLRPNLWRKI